LTGQQVENYCRQQLASSELLAVTDHLANCQICRGRVERGLNGDAAFFSLRGETFGEFLETAASGSQRLHPTSYQTLQYVDGNLTGEELQIVTDHLSSCEVCALAIDDLHTFRVEAASSLDREYRPEPAIITAERTRRTSGFFSNLFRPQRLAFGMALAVLLLVVSGWLIWRAPSTTAPVDEESAEAPPAPNPNREAVPLVAQLNDGEGRLTLDRDGNLAGADHLPPSYQAMLKEALSGRRLELSSQLQGLTRPPSQLRSGDKAESTFSVREPAGRVLLTGRPVFRWTRLEGAASYVVEVYDSKFNLVASSPELTGQSWSMPGALPPGGVYTWQVKATKDGQEIKAPLPPLPQARFRVLDQAKANELATAKRTYPASHLTLGLLYAEAGLLDEAEQELRAVQKANPDSELARSLVGQIQKLKR
jgi:hypothetical protein